MNKDPAQARLLKAFHEHESQLRGYLHRYAESDHDIDDICQETMVRSLEAAKRQQVRQPGAFLFGIARNIVRKRFERKSRSLIDFVADFTPDDYAADAPSLDDIMDARERLSRCDEAIARLPPQSVEEAIINAMIAAETMTMIKPTGCTWHAIDHDRLCEVMKKCSWRATHVRPALRL